MPLEPADVTDEMLDALHSSRDEDAVFWSAVRGAARAPDAALPKHRFGSAVHARENRYPDLSNDAELFDEVMR
jgi:hypothetical protein